MEIKVELATGIPIPKVEALDKNNQIVGRELKICLFD